MNRLLTLAGASTIAATMSSFAWSQAAQTGGNPSGAATGTAGSANTTGTAGASDNVGTAGSPPGTGQNPSGQFGASNSNFNTIPQRPFFSDPGVRQQLNLNDAQFNALNRAYLNSYNRYNQGVTGLGTNNTTTQNNATNNAITSRREQLQDFRSRINNNTNVGAGTATAAEQRAQQLQAFEDRFNSDFGPTVDQTLTDPQLRRRYDQLYRQYMGSHSFNDPALQRQLSLTADQRGQLRRLETEWRRQMTDWRRQMRNDDPAAQQQWAQLRSQYMDQLNAVLTPQQQQSWTGLVGQPYEFPYQTYFPPNQIPNESGNVLKTDQLQPDPTQATQPPTGENTLR